MFTTAFDVKATIDKKRKCDCTYSTHYEVDNPLEYNGDVPLPNDFSVEWNGHSCYNEPR